MSISKYENIWQLLKKHKFEFIDQIDSDLKCSICENVLINACHNLCCCKYCLDCIRQYLNGMERYCPNLSDDCKEQMINMKRDIQINHATNRKISKLKVKCPEQSCEFCDNLINIEEHIGTHRRKCPFIEIGCDKMNVDTITINDHIESESLFHGKLMMDYFQNFENEIMYLKENLEEKETEVLQLRNRFEQIEKTDVFLDEEMAALLNIVENLESKNEIEQHNFSSSKVDFGIVMADFEKEEKRLRLQVGDLDQKISKTNASRNGRCASSSHIRNKKPEFPKGSRKKIEEIYPMVSPVYVAERIFLPHRWMFPGFAATLEAAKCGLMDGLVSEAVYTHENGYKLCTVIYPNGTGNGKNTHLSVGYHLMKGKFDHLVQWPMKHHITVSLHYNTAGSACYSVTFDYDSEPNKKCFARPKSEFNLPFIKQKFIDFNFLLNDKQLLKEDTLVVGCQIELHGTRVDSNTK